MLEHLSPEEFEDWCRVLLERHFRCRVEGTPYVGDEGRDLIVHLPTGRIVVECKHQPHSSVGRPVVQKLDSAARTAGAKKAMIMTTGSFSRAAAEYARSVRDVAFDLIDGAKLAYMAEKAGLSPSSSYIDDKSSLAVSTTPDHQFPQMFLRTVFQVPRFHPGRGYGIHDFTVSRSTTYEGRYVGSFHASGQLDTAAGIRSASWSGTIWASLDGKDCGFLTSDPPGNRILPLGQVLSSTPGESSPPSIQPHEAASRMKEFVLNACSKRTRYRGQNNVTYERWIKPQKRTTHVDNVHLIYFPKQAFALKTNAALHLGTVDETGAGLTLNASSLSECCVCHRPTSAGNQVFCAVCHRPAHQWDVLHPDSFRCRQCQATICRDHTRRSGGNRVCTRCAERDAKRLGSRWLPHLAFAVVMTAIAGLILYLITAAGFPHEVGNVLAVMTAVAALGCWYPLDYVASRFRPSNRVRPLVYELAPPQVEPAQVVSPVDAG